MYTLDRQEHIADITFAANTVRQLPTNGGLIPNDRYMSGLRLMFEGRLTNPAADMPVAVNADAPFALINRVIVRGNHRPRNQQETIVDLRGADLRELVRIYNGAALYSTGTLGLAANQVMDLRFQLDVPFVPLGVGLQQQSHYLLDAPNYDSLTLEIGFADTASVFTCGVGVVAVSAFGQVGGTPRVRVSGLFAQDGVRRFAGYLPARLVRYMVEVGGTDLTTTGNERRLWNILKGHRVRAILAKTGVKAVVTAGNDAFLTLSNTILNNIKINQGLNRAIRYYPDAFLLQAENVANGGIVPSAGYGLIDFAPRGALDMALDTAPLMGGAQGNTDLYVGADVVGAAGQAAAFIVEELRYRPQSAPAPGAGRVAVPVRRR